MARTTSTKDKYILEALKLFAERGYGSVKTTDIAKAVGCVPSALYKHYKSKKELYNAILENSIQGYMDNLSAANLDFEKIMMDKEKIRNFSVEEQIDNLKALIKLVLHNEYAVAFRKLMIIEQYHDKRLAQMYDDRYIKLQYNQCMRYFETLMDEGIIKKADPYTLAVLYVSPIILMVEMCDREPGSEEKAMEIIEKHVKEFYKSYLI